MEMDTEVAEGDEERGPHGTGESVRGPPPKGKMWAVGWHASMEKKKKLVYYSPKSGKHNAEK